MRLFIIILSAGLSWAALAQETSVVGLWTWSGTGCRAYDLTPQSHNSRSKNEGLSGITASALRLYADGQAEMTTNFGGRIQNNTGVYEVTEDDQVVINEEDFILSIVGGRLLIEGTPEESEQVCGGNGSVFVYVLGRVDEDPSARP